MIHVPPSPTEGVAWKPGVSSVKGVVFRLLFQFHEWMVLREVDVSFPFLIQTIHFNLYAFTGGHLLQAAPQNVRLTTKHVEKSAGPQLLVLGVIPGLLQRFSHPLGQVLRVHGLWAGRSARHGRPRTPLPGAPSPRSLKPSRTKVKITPRHISSNPNPDRPKREVPTQSESVHGNVFSTIVSPPSPEHPKFTSKTNQNTRTCPFHPSHDQPQEGSAPFFLDPLRDQAGDADFFGHSALGCPGEKQIMHLCTRRTLPLQSEPAASPAHGPTPFAQL